jgi:hypothetical protein
MSKPKRKSNRPQKFPETGIERTSLTVPKGHRARCLTVAKAAVMAEYQTILIETQTKHK